jgi:hypothetical protein
MTSMVSPWGALPAGPAASTPEFEDDVNGGTPEGHCRWVRQRPPLSFEDYVGGGPPRGRCRQVRQHPPLKLKKMSMTGPLGGVAGGSDSVRH